MTEFSHDHLIDGYISYTFGPQDAENYMVILFKVDAQTVVATRDQNGAFYVLKQPSQYSSPTLSIDGQNAWLVDYAIRSAGSVVPQRPCFPRAQAHQTPVVDRAQFCVPFFFVNMDRFLGVPIMDASTGRMHLHGGNLPLPLADNMNSVKIHLGWPGYNTSYSLIKLGDCNPQKNSLTLEKFVQLVGRHIKEFLLDCEQVPIQPFEGGLGMEISLPMKLFSLALSNSPKKAGRPSSN